MTRFVIVTPCLDGQRYLAETLHSVVSQAGDFEIRYRVQDGGSTDGSLRILADWNDLLGRGTFPVACRGVSFSYHSGRDGGLYPAINRGFEQAGVQDGDWMGWINADDLLVPGALATLAAIERGLPQARWVSGRTAHVDAAGIPTRHFELRPYPRFFLGEGLHDGRHFPLLSQEGTFWKADLWREGGPLDESFALAGDYDLWRRFAAHAHLFVVDAVLARFRVHERQKSSDLAAYYAEVDRTAHPDWGNSRGTFDTLAASKAPAGRYSWRFVAHGIREPVIAFDNETEDSTRSGVFAALVCDQLDVLRQYFQAGVSPRIKDDEGVPLYVRALLSGRYDAFELCAAHGLPSPTELDRVSKAVLKDALCEAIEAHNARLAENIIRLGVPLEERSGDRPLPLLMSVYVDDLAITRHLVAGGANVDACNLGGSAVLLDAIWMDRPEQVEVLVEGGADLSVRNQTGQDAIAMAESLGRDRIAAYLRAAKTRRRRTNVAGMVLDVCICTHNPRRDIFALVVASLAAQDAPRSKFRVLVIDNASMPPIGPGDLAPLATAGIDFRIVVEPRLGNVFSRAAAIAQSTSEWILFVDDDNQLAPDYISHGLRIIATRPELGCFGGRLDLAPNLAPPKWMLPLLPYLAVRDFGDEEITHVADYWGKWEPATAGGFVNRDILNLYVERITNDDRVHELGRKGKRSLNSGEDSLMMWGAHTLGLAGSYQPGLRLVHHINPERFNFNYFFRLMQGYGKSNAILDKLHGRGNAPVPVATMLRQFLENWRATTLRYAVCLAAYHVGYNKEVARP